MGTRVPILLVDWGPGSPIYQENGDPFVRMGTYNKIKQRGIKSYLRDEDGDLYMMKTPI